MTTTACDDQFAPEPVNHQRLDAAAQQQAEYPENGRALLSARARQTIEELWHQRSELRAERDALAAHVERLQSQMDQVMPSKDMGADLDELYKLYDEFEATTTTSLAKHDAELLEETINEFAQEIWTEMLKHHRAIKVLPLSMARTYLDRRMMAKGGAA